MVHNYVLKKVQQKQLGVLGREGQFLHEEQCSFSLGECLEIWRWIQDDLTSSRAREQEGHEQYNEVN
jgi:hypothetical protein